MKVLLQSFFDYLADEWGIQERRLGTLPSIDELALRLSQSFVVETRVTLLTFGRVEILDVGVLSRREREDVLFEPDAVLLDDLRHEKYRLGDYLLGFSGERFFPQEIALFSGMTSLRGLSLLTRVGSWLLERLVKRDPGLRKLALEQGEEERAARLTKALGLTIHDEICHGRNGRSFELDSIGIFIPSKGDQTVGFLPDEHLIASLAATAVGGQTRNRGKLVAGPKVLQAAEEEGEVHEHIWRGFLPEERRIFSREMPPRP